MVLLGQTKSAYPRVPPPTADSSGHFEKGFKERISILYQNSPASKHPWCRVLELEISSTSLSLIAVGGLCHL